MATTSSVTRRCIKCGLETKLKVVDLMRQGWVERMIMFQRYWVCWKCNGSPRK